MDFNLDDQKTDPDARKTNPDARKIILVAHMIDQSSGIPKWPIGPMDFLLFFTIFGV